MGFIRCFCTAATAIIFTFVLAIQAFAVSIDGSVSPDEVRGTNVQIQCENENGGNGICALATYYTKTEKGSLYVAINGDISYADLTKESPVVYEIYVDGKDPIKISITGKAEYDEQLFKRQTLRIVCRRRDNLRGTHRQEIFIRRRPGNLCQSHRRQRRSVKDV